MAKKAEIKTVPFMTDIPVNTIELTITAKIYEGGQIYVYEGKIADMEDIRAGMINGKKYEEENAVYQLTDEALKMLKGAKQ